ncbi:hypothetical protein CCR91_10930 [Thiorhodovibrio winogradskyi]|nr:hypothetical protein [Thiorhodovibrio winogradskyi]
MSAARWSAAAEPEITDAMELEDDILEELQDIERQLEQTQERVDAALAQAAQARAENAQARAEAEHEEKERLLKLLKAAGIDPDRTDST